MPKEKSTRNQEIYERIKEGAAPNDMAILFGISRQRVHQICLIQKQWGSIVNPAVFKEALNMLTRKSLIRFCDDPKILDRPEDIADLGPEYLEQANKIGPKSLRSIAEALHRFDYIDDPDKWLAKKK